MEQTNTNAVSWGALIVVLVTAFALRVASAEERGAVLKVDGGKAYVDLGTDAGVGVGSELTLYHVIAVKHPVTGKNMTDSFPLAVLKVVNVGKTISVAAVPASFRKRIKIGDRIELASKPTDYVDPWTRPSGQLVDPYSKSTDASEPTRAARERAIARAKKRIAGVAGIEAAWAETLGKTPEERLVIWRDYLDANPKSPYRGVVSRASAELEKFIASVAAEIDESSADAISRVRTEKLARLVGNIDPQQQLIHERPKRIDEGVALELAFLATRRDSIQSAFLYYRRAGEDAYLRRELTRDGDTYWVGQVPADAVRPPGVEYFVETVSGQKGATPQRVVASDAAPVAVAVEAVAASKPSDRRGRSRVRVVLDYVDFDGVGSANKFDQYWYAEVDFMLRFRLKGLYSMRLGFGTMNGTGGPKDVIDDDPTNSCLENGVFRCREVSYNYAFTELEWRIGDNVGLMLRPQMGSAHRDNMPVGAGEREFFDAFGLRGRVRVGREDGSNLVIGASATQELGKLYEGAFTWDVLEEVPLVFSVHVTDQPVIEDFGVRLIADIGLRKIPWIYPSLRIAYQARDIDHAGLSAGLAANFDW